jgi:hypothetical protein
MNLRRESGESTAKPPSNRGFSALRAPAARSRGRYVRLIYIARPCAEAPHDPTVRQSVAAGSSAQPRRHAREEIMQQHLRLTPDEHRSIRNWLIAITVVYAFFMLVLASLVIVGIHPAAPGADTTATAMRHDASGSAPSPDARRPAAQQ